MTAGKLNTTYEVRTVNLKCCDWPKLSHNYDLVSFLFYVVEMGFRTHVYTLCNS